MYIFLLECTVFLTERPLIHQMHLGLPINYKCDVTDPILGCFYSERNCKVLSNESIQNIEYKFRSVYLRTYDIKNVDFLVVNDSWS